MASWRDQRADKERVEREREEAAATAKKQKLAGLSATSSTEVSTVRIYEWHCILSESMQVPAITVTA
jgi:hypothetical protein